MTPSEYDRPFTLTRDNTVYVPTGHMPFKLGTLELEQVIINRINELTRELNHWNQLGHDNTEELERAAEGELYAND